MPIVYNTWVYLHISYIYSTYSTYGMQIAVGEQWSCQNKETWRSNHVAAARIVPCEQCSSYSDLLPLYSTVLHTAYNWQLGMHLQLCNFMYIGIKIQIVCNDQRKEKCSEYYCCLFKTSNLRTKLPCARSAHIFSSSDDLNSIYPDILGLDNLQFYLSVFGHINF